MDALTLYKGKFSNGRRLDGVPQLTCHGSVCDSFQPEVVRCYNRGTDGLEIQWECRAEMPDNIRFGKVQVTCEGYDHAKDEFILNGSCGLEYTLKVSTQSFFNDSKVMIYNFLPSRIFLGTMTVQLKRFGPL